MEELKGKGVKVVERAMNRAGYFCWRDSWPEEGVPTSDWWAEYTRCHAGVVVDAYRVTYSPKGRARAIKKTF